MFGTIFFVFSFFKPGLSTVKDEFKGNWDAANRSCSLRTPLVGQSWSGASSSLPAWININVLLSDWASFIGCLNVQHDISDDEGRQTLGNMFPNYSSNISGTNSIDRCLLTCTEGKRYRFFIYYKKVCLCLPDEVNRTLNQSSMGLYPGRCNVEHNLKDPQIPYVFAFTSFSSSFSPTPLRLYSLRSGLHCLFLDTSASASCRENFQYSCGYGEYECVEQNSSRLQCPVYLNTSKAERTTCTLIRYMHVLSNEDQKEDYLPYIDSLKCLLLQVITNNEPVFRVENCSFEYGRICSSTNNSSSTVDNSITTTDRFDENTVSGKENTTSHKENTSIHPNTEDTGMQAILIVNIVLLNCIVFTCLIAFAWKLYKKRLLIVAGEQHLNDPIHYRVEDEHFTLELEGHYSEIRDID